MCTLTQTAGYVKKKHSENFIIKEKLAGRRKKGDALAVQCAFVFAPSSILLNL